MTIFCLSFEILLFRILLLYNEPEWLWFIYFVFSFFLSPHFMYCLSSMWLGILICYNILTLVHSNRWHVLSSLLNRGVRFLYSTNFCLQCMDSCGSRNLLLYLWNIYLSSPAIETEKKRNREERKVLGTWYSTCVNVKMLSGQSSVWLNFDHNKSSNPKFSMQGPYEAQQNSQAVWHSVIIVKENKRNNEN